MLTPSPPTPTPGRRTRGNNVDRYTPGNGALLSAVAMMVGGGWDGDGGIAAPGLPQDGSWKVLAEGFHKMF